MKPFHELTKTQRTIVLEIADSKTGESGLPAYRQTTKDALIEAGWIRHEDIVQDWGFAMATLYSYVLTDEAYKTLVELGKVQLFYGAQGSRKR